MAISAPVHDTATLSGATATAGGTVTYTVYTDNACTQNAQGAGTKTVTNGTVPNSDPMTFADAGDYYWQAAYSGDAENNGAKSVCTEEHLVVNPNTTSVATAQSVIPNDSATIGGATAGAGGTVTFSLYGPDDASCSTAPKYTEAVTTAVNGTYATGNTAFKAGAGTWRWQVSYSGDADNRPSTSSRGTESFTITNG